MHFKMLCGKCGPFCLSLNVLTHWGRVTYICISKLTFIGSDNGLLPDWCQAIIWTNAGILLIWTSGTNFSEILSKIHTFLLQKMHLKMLSAKWYPFCLDFTVLSYGLPSKWYLSNNDFIRPSQIHSNGILLNISMVYTSSTLGNFDKIPDVFLRPQRVKLQYAANEQTCVGCEFYICTVKLSCARLLCTYIS